MYMVKKLQDVTTKSLYGSRAGIHFYGTEYEIWTDFGPIGNTEKKIWTDYEQLLREGFSTFGGAKKNLNIHNQLCIAVLETPPCATSIY